MHVVKQPFLHIISLCLLTLFLGKEIAGNMQLLRAQQTMALCDREQSGSENPVAEKEAEPEHKFLSVLFRLPTLPRLTGPERNLFDETPLPQIAASKLTPPPENC
ncbi:hypothetical protein GCM10027051_12580 [Niabella terrae]